MADTKDQKGKGKAMPKESEEQEESDRMDREDGEDEESGDEDGDVEVATCTRHKPSMKCTQDCDPC